MRDKEQFIEDCRRCLTETNVRAAVQELVSEAVSDPRSVMRALGEPSRAGVETIFQADDLTILNLSWGPGMDLYPHDHRMWAVIGIYVGQEDNSFYQRDAEHGLKQHGLREMRCGDVAALGVNAIHGVRNPLNSLTSAIHVYGGDFFNTPRSEWDPDSFQERPYSVEGLKKMFEDSNQRLDELRAAGQ